jgi:hypothetical protein
MTVANQWNESGVPSQETLKAAIEKSSFIRSLSMISEDGKVLASSEEAVVHQQINWQQLGLDRDVGADLAAGRWQPVRNLLDLYQGNDKLRKMAILPLSIRLKRSQGDVVRWLVLINPSDLIDGLAETVDEDCDDTRFSSEFILVANIEWELPCIFYT